MYKIFTSLFFVIVSSIGLMGQNINKVEYFLDTDPGFGGGTDVPVMAAPSINNFTFTVPMSTISDGFHTLFVRSRDANNRWSITQARPFLKLSPIAPAVNLTRIEYYIDNDPGFGTATNVPFTPALSVSDLVFTIPVSTLSDGFHTLFVRSRDANNRWSVIQARPFIKLAAPSAAVNLNRIEYFVDTDPGYGNGINVPFTTSTSVNDLVFTVNVAALTQGPHKLYVRSRDVNNRWSIIQVRDFTVCNQPAPVTSAATSITTTGFTANWSAASGATSYRLDVSADNFATFVTGNNDRTITGATSASVTGLTPGVSYKYRVRAVNITCASVNSSIVDVTTLFNAPIANAASNVNATSFTANWSAVSGAASYRLDVSADNFVTFINGYNNKTVTGTNDAVTGLTPSTAYKYRVRAVSASSVLSANSNEISVSTGALPLAPVAIAASAISSTGFTANWNAVTGATGYRLDVSADNFVTFISGFNDRAVGTTSNAVTGLTGNTTYQYRVRAINANGVSANSNVINVITTTAPQPPVAIAASSISSQGFTANWNAVPGATGYRLDVSADNFVTLITGFNDKSVTGTSDLVQGLNPSTAYRYRVRAVNANGTSINSNIIEVTTSATPTGPSAPVAIEASSISASGFTANWNAVTGATGYRLDVSPDNFATFVTGYNDRTVSSISDAVTGLTTGTAYRYRVRAVNALGTSINSNVIEVTTLSKQDQTITFASLADRTEGDASFTLLATASSGLTVSFESLNTDKVSISGNSVSLLAPGSATIRAKQNGNDEFNAAPNVDRTFCIRPAKPTITLSNGNTELPVLSSSAGNGNQWFRNGTVIDGAVGVTLSVTQPGIYTVRSTIEGCASDLSNGQAIIITGDIPSGNQPISVYPNPLTDLVYVSLTSFTKGTTVQVRLIDFTGKVLRQHVGKGGDIVELSVAEFTSGAYLITAEQGSMSEQIKIIKK